MYHKFPQNITKTFNFPWKKYNTKVHIRLVFVDYLLSYQRDYVNNMNRKQ